MTKEKKKKSKLSKVLKWLAGILLVLIIALISAPFLFKDKIVKLVANTVNNNINATLSYSDSDLSLFTKFPLADVTLKDITIINKAPFEGDTLYYAEEIHLSMKLTELLKKTGETLELKRISTKNGEVNIKINKDNIGNYDIAKKSENTEASNNSSSLSLNINSYELENIDFSYADATTLTNLKLDSIVHFGTGNFAQEVLDLDTKTTAKLSLDIENINYVSNVNVKLDALLGINLNELKYSFKENKGYINQLPIEFDGFIQQVDDTQVYNLSFKTPTSSFKNALALLPEQYSGNLKNIETEGNFDLQGTVNGVYSKTTIPKIDVTIQSTNAMFKYPDLPKAVRNINLNAKVLNDTGNAKDTYLTFNELSFKIDEDVFNANGKISQIITNPIIALKAKGKVNLGNLNKVYPLNLKQQLKGIVNADVTTNFDMNSITQKKYQNVKNSGTIGISNFEYNDTEVANPIKINKTTVNFNTAKISLTEFDATTGSSDLGITGNLDNFYGFLFNNEKLKGNFNLKSNTFKVDDFLTEAKSDNTSNTKATLKIPSFLDINLNANANKVYYDNIVLNNVSGKLNIKDEAVALENLKTNVFGGDIGLNGNVSTKTNTPTFAVDLNLDQLNIAESFNGLEMLTAIAPIAKALEGKVNSTIKLSGVLDEHMAPNLKNISGDLFGQLLNTRFQGDSKMMNLLGDKLSFLDPEKFNFDQVTAKLKFNNGVVTVKPIPLKYKDINLTIAGTHSFDKSVNYSIDIDVPAKYLGTNITNALQKLTPKDAAEIKSVPVKATVSGSFTNPSVTTNIKDATANLLKTIVEKQKQSLIDKGKDKLNDLLNSNTKDSTKTTNNNNVKNVIKNIFGRKKDTTQKKKDSVN